MDERPWWWYEATSGCSIYLRLDKRGTTRALVTVR
jgi:hypothetical protein